MTATVTVDYVADERTNTNTTLSDVVLNAATNIDIDMVKASGTHGYVINGGAAASNYKEVILVFVGNARVDTLIGNRGNDTLVGGTGADIFMPGRGNSTIQDAGNGEDIIIHDSGTSVIIRNHGTDTVTLQSSAPNAIVVADQGIRTVDASTSTSGAWLNGNSAGSNKVTYIGGSSDDTIYGGIGNDALTGNAGNDTFKGGLGADTIAIGNGTNTVIFTSGLSIDEISGYTGDDIGSFSLELETENAVTNGATMTLSPVAEEVIPYWLATQLIYRKLVDQQHCWQQQTS